MDNVIGSLMSFKSLEVYPYEDQEDHSVAKIEVHFSEPLK